MAPPPRLSAHAFPLPVLRSMLQKAVRQGDEPAAVAAALELAASGIANGAFERLVSVGLEDVGWPGWRAIAAVREEHRLADRDRKAVGLGWNQAHGSPAVRERLVRSALLLCRARHLHASAWLNMLALHQGVHLEGDMQARVAACARELAEALDRRDTVAAAARASLLHLARDCGVQHGEPGRQARGLHHRVAASALGPAWTALLEAAHPEHRPFLRELSRLSDRLAVMTAVLLVTRDPDGVDADLLPDADDAPAVAAAWPASFFSETAGRVWAADRLRIPDALPYVDKHVAYAEPPAGISGSLPAREWARSHPPADALAPDARTHRAFIERHTALKRPHPDEDRWGPPAKRLYLEGDPERRRARHFYGEAYRAAFGCDYAGK